MTYPHARRIRPGPLGVDAKATLRIVAVLGSIVTTSACQDASAPDIRQSLTARVAAATQPKVDALLANVVRRYNLPGIVAGVIRDGGIVAQGAAGVRHIGFADRIAVVDRFHLGSNVKAMTSTMIATVVEDGRLAWTSTPASIFPELASAMNPQLANATLEQILQHRGGLPAYTEVEDLASLPPFDGTVSEQRRAFAAYVLRGAAGTTRGSYLYSNAGYIIAAAMAERVSGESWEQLMKARVFGPLRMRVSSGWPAASDPAQPWGHFWSGDALVAYDPLGEFQLPPSFGPAGDISMSLQDYAEFVKLHLRALRGHPRLLSGASYTRLHAPNGDYALGWIVGDIEGAAFIGHEGTSGAFHALVLIFPTKNIAVAVLINAGGQAASECGG